MDTETTIETDLKISVHYGGVTPIGGGRMSFSPNHLSRIAPTNDNTFVRRILFADLLTNGIYKEFRVVYSSGYLENHSSVRLTNPAGEEIPFSDEGRLLYIKSNVATIIESNYSPLPATLNANGALLLDSTFSITNPPQDESVINLKWLASGITAIGSGNFYCDLILAVS